MNIFAVTVNGIRQTVEAKTYGSALSKSTKDISTADYYKIEISIKLLEKGMTLASYEEMKQKQMTLL